MRSPIHYTTYFLGLITALTNCASPPAESPVTAVPNITVVSAEGPEATVKQFIKWTAAHYDKLPSKFIDHASGSDTTKHYAVNLPETERWLTAITQSGVFSKVYLNHWRGYFQQYADTLRLQPQNDGPAKGFEYDFLLMSQEPDSKITELQAGTLTTQRIGASQAVVHALGPQHEGWREGFDFYLSRNAAGRWLIDSTSVPDNLIQ